MSYSSRPYDKKRKLGNRNPNKISTGKEQQSYRNNNHSSSQLSKDDLPFKDNISLDPSLARPYSVSIALPASIITNALTPELKTYLAGQIARSLVIFNIDEVIVFNDAIADKAMDSSTHPNSFFEGAKNSNPIQFLCRILQYLETPPYLRKHLFPLHPDLKYAGLLNSVEAPHHLRMDQACKFRDGITLDRPSKKGEGSFVNIGLKKDAQIDRKIRPGIRVTVELEDEHANVLKGKVISPKIPRERFGYYWGYRTRMADTISKVFSECPYEEGYDLTVGTSKKGSSVDNLGPFPKFKHALIVFGGQGGIEAAVDVDQDLNYNANESEKLFQYWINVCPFQGSESIRTEEAMLICMSSLRSRLSASRFSKN